MIIKSKKGIEYEIVIGLEVHAQIKSELKLFSKSKTNWDSEPNTNISSLDIGLPGALPVLNFECVKQVIKVGVAINGKINQESYFDRKNYFYPDLPTGYQITQFYKPIIENGYLSIELEDGSEKKIGIRQIHIEQDAGKSIHDRYSDKTSLDFNRAGVGLMEIVSNPDFRSPYEVGEYLKNLRAILRATIASDADMEKGSMRCDANVSVRIKGSTELGTRCEIKNLNSIKFLSSAIQYEASRQIEIIENGETISQETRLFDSVKNETKTMRTKEDANDYRYFPDPDLQPLRISNELINEITSSLPELPIEKLKRYTENFGFTKKEIGYIALDPEYSNYFDKLTEKHNPKLCYTWFVVELLGRLNKEQINLSDSKISPQLLIELLDLIQSGKINGKIAKDVLDEMLKEIKLGKIKKPSDIVKNLGLEQIDNDQEILEFIEEVINSNPSQLAEYKSGKDRLFGFFVGEVMKKAKGKANPAKVNELLKSLLK